MYPPENAGLAGRIVANGAIISEYPMGAKPDAVNFPKRNRIISGLALGTVIVETGPDGGAMITAAAALEQNREVFAVPAQVSEKHRSGTNLLIKEGKAFLTESVDDIVTELGPRLAGIARNSAAVQKPPPDLSLFEQRIHDALSDEPIHIEAPGGKPGLLQAPEFFA